MSNKMALCKERKVAFSFLLQIKAR